MDISFFKFLSCPHSAVRPVALCMLKCSEGDGNHIPTSTPVSLTTLKLLSRTVSFFAVTLVVPPAIGFQECMPLIIVEVPLFARRLWIATPLWFHPREEKQSFYSLFTSGNLQKIAIGKAVWNGNRKCLRCLCRIWRSNSTITINAHMQTLPKHTRTANFLASSKRKRPILGLWPL